jgi:hypothetical protein
MKRAERLVNFSSPLCASGGLPPVAFEGGFWRSPQYKADEERPLSVESSLPVQF